MESKFQSQLIRDLRHLFPGCIILMNDPNYLQGVPDVLMLWQDRWAALECKASRGASRQPNQEYYVELMNRMSFAAFVCPDNKEDVLYDLQFTFRPRRAARVSQR